MKPQLAAPIGPRFHRFPCYVQPKLNGIRALHQNRIFQSRGEKLWKAHFFPHISDQIASLNLASTILDGELYHHTWKLQRINSAVGVNNNEPNSDTASIIFNVFDIVHPELSFSDRWMDIRNTIISANLPNVSAVDTSYVHDREQLERYFHMCVAQGYEGTMLRPEGPYIFGETPQGTRKNSPYLWKYKSWQDDEFVCVGVTDGEGKASIGIGALICAVNNISNRICASDVVTFKVGTGFDDIERIKYRKHPPIGKLIRVRYLDLTDEGRPFNPSFLAVMN